MQTIMYRLIDWYIPDDIVKSEMMVLMPNMNIVHFAESDGLAAVKSRSNVIILMMLHFTVGMVKNIIEINDCNNSVLVL